MVKGRWPGGDGSLSGVKYMSDSFCPVSFGEQHGARIIFYD